MLQGERLELRHLRASRFRPVGVMRRHERGAVSGEWDDNLLMDLPAEEPGR